MPSTHKLTAVATASLGRTPGVPNILRNTLLVPIFAVVGRRGFCLTVCCAETNVLVKRETGTLQPLLISCYDSYVDHYRICVFSDCPVAFPSILLHKVLQENRNAQSRSARILRSHGGVQPYST